MRLKKVVFEEYDVTHASLVLKLKSIKVSQKDFFQSLTRLFVQDHPCLDAFQEYLMQNNSSLGNRSKKKLKDSQLSGRRTLSSFGFSDDDVSAVFDLLEDEGVLE